jgi:acyl-CoA reductase-like NAD-dependent aldehyde dehydrogenase
MSTHGLYLGGQWRRTESALSVVNPATGETVGQVCTVARSEVAQALHTAHSAWGAWRGLTGKARGDYLRKIADHVERRGEEIARSITLENGKPLAQSVGEVAMTWIICAGSRRRRGGPTGALCRRRWTGSATSLSSRRSGSWQRSARGISRASWRCGAPRRQARHA